MLEVVLVLNDMPILHGNLELLEKINKRTTIKIDNLFPYLLLKGI